MTSRSLPVQEILDGKREVLDLELLTKGVPLDRCASDPDLTSPGLALAGHTARIPHGRMWVFGETEMTYVETLSEEIGRTARIEVSVCGEMASNPLGAFLLLGLDITALSMAWPSLPEIRELISGIRMEDARIAAKQALSAGNSSEVIQCLADKIGNPANLRVFQGRWNLSIS